MINRSRFAKAIFLVLFMALMLLSLTELGKSENKGKEITSDLPGNPIRMVVGSDQSVWLAANNYPGINRVYPDGRVEKYKTPFRSPPIAMSLDKNNSLWSYANQSSIVIQIDETGGIKPFPLPYSGNPLQMVIGDTVTWLSGDDSAVITKINQSTSDLEKIETSLDSNPRNIIPANDEGAWLISSSSLKIVHINKEGEEKVFEFSDKILDVKNSKDGIWISFQGKNYLRYIPQQN